jgi:hypothetical protein
MPYLVSTSNGIGERRPGVVRRLGRHRLRPVRYARDPLFELVRSDPETAWPLVISYAKEHPGDGRSSSLIEEFIYQHDDRFVDWMELAARDDWLIRELIAQAYVGGIAGGERFHELQAHLRRQLGWHD